METKEKITEEQRGKLDYEKKFDCYGIELDVGDDVEVVEEWKYRKDQSEYNFCSVGKKGKITSKDRSPSWGVHVKFPESEQSIGCTDISLKKL